MRLQPVALASEWSAIHDVSLELFRQIHRLQQRNFMRMQPVILASDWSVVHDMNSEPSSKHAEQPLHRIMPRWATPPLTQSSQKRTPAAEESIAGACEWTASNMFE